LTFLLAQSRNYDISVRRRYNSEGQQRMVLPVSDTRERAYNFRLVGS
jgi:hypothetical protein